MHHSEAASIIVEIIITSLGYWHQKAMKIDCSQKCDQIVCQYIFRIEGTRFSFMWLKALPLTQRGSRRRMGWFYIHSWNEHATVQLVSTEYMSWPIVEKTPDKNSLEFWNVSGSSRNSSAFSYITTPSFLKKLNSTSLVIFFIIASKICEGRKNLLWRNH